MVLQYTMYCTQRSYNIVGASLSKQISIEVVAKHSRLHHIHSVSSHRIGYCLHLTVFDQALPPRLSPSSKAWEWNYGQSKLPVVNLYTFLLLHACKEQLAMKQMVAESYYVITINNNYDWVLLQTSQVWPPRWVQPGSSCIVFTWCCLVKAEESYHVCVGTYEISRRTSAAFCVVWTAWLLTARSWTKIICTCHTHAVTIQTYHSHMDHLCCVLFYTMFTSIVIVCTGWNEDQMWRSWEIEGK